MLLSLHAVVNAYSECVAACGPVNHGVSTERQSKLNANTRIPSGNSIYIMSIFAEIKVLGRNERERGEGGGRERVGGGKEGGRERERRREREKHRGGISLVNGGTFMYFIHTSV